MQTEYGAWRDERIRVSKGQPLRSRLVDALILGAGALVAGALIALAL